MSFQIFDVFGDIRFEGMDQVMGQITNLGSGLSSLGGQITNFGGRLIDGISKPIVGLIEQGVKYNSTIENLQSNFAVLLGSEEKAAQMTQKLKEMGAKTPFEVVGLAQATKTLLNYGYTNENVLPIMNRLGDVSLGNDERFQGLALVMGQVNSLGKLQAGDLNQLINRGWNPLNQIQKRTGESMAQIRERMKDGKVSYKELEQALVDATSAGGQFYGGMDKGSQTLSGKISTLKDTFNEFLGSAVKPISDWIGAVLVPKLTQLGEYLGGLSEKTKAMILIGAAVAAGIGPLVVGIGILITVIGGIISAAGTIGTVLAALSPEIIAIIAVVAAVVAVVAAVGVAIDYMLIKMGIVKPMWDLLVSAFNTAKPIVISLVKEGIEKMHQAFDLVKKIIDDVSKVAKPFLLETIKEAKPIVNDIVKALGEFGKALLDNLGTKIKQAKEIWDAVWPYLKPVVETVFGAVKTIVITVLEVIKGIIKTATALIKGDWSGAWDGIKSIFGSVWDGIKAMAQNATNGMINILATIGPKILNIIQQIPGIIVSINGAISSKAAEIGTAIINGIVNGIKAGLKWVSNAAADVANSAIKSAKSALGIKSPSKVFEEIGDYVTQGFVIGVDENKVKRTMENIADLVKDPFKSDNLNLGNTSLNQPSQAKTNENNITNIFNLNIDFDNISDVIKLKSFLSQLQVESVTRGGVL